MSPGKLILNSLRHYRGINLSVMAGVALTSAILSGALVVGDSVKESLRRNAENRISKAGPALVGGERFVTAALADRIGKEAGDATIAPLLQIEGTVSNRGGGQRANKVQIVGVDDRFWKLSLSGEKPEALKGDKWFAINSALASRLEASAGDTLIVRVELPGAISKDAPLSGESEQTTPFTGEISAIIEPENFSRYSLRAEQVPSPTVFLPLAQLQQTLEQPGKANVLLGEDTLTDEEFAKSVNASWDMKDVSLSVSSLPDGNGSQVLSDRIFIDKASLEAVEKSVSKSSPVLTYLANEIQKGKNSTPYSMVSGTGPLLNRIALDGLKDSEIILSDWVAEDLDAKVGDTVTLKYFTVSTGRKLTEQSETFQVADVRKIGEAGWDQSWTPNFPGIANVDDLDEWEPGIPIDRDRIRQKDEDYWDDHKATPKAFVTLNAARKMWANRFGDTTSIRTGASSDADTLQSDLRENLDLSELGMAFRNLKMEADAAVSQSFDFGQLFAYMSFFLIIAALVLASLLFMFGIEQRSSQIGLLLALGLTKKRVRGLFLKEALILSVIGSVIGLLGGVIYTKLALAGMSGAWRDAAAGIEFVYYLTPISLGFSFVLTLVFALCAVWLASRKVLRYEPSELITGSEDVGATRSSAPWWRSFSAMGSLLCLLAGLGCLFAPKIPGTMAEQGMFFGAGFLFTLSGVCLCSVIISRFGRPSETLRSLAALGRQHTVRKRGRSLAVIGLMAAGVFMVTAINSFRLEGERGANRRDSGTGGFAFVGESTLPIYEDLQEDHGREKYGIEELTKNREDVSILSMRVSDGDDASCLNLNRAQRPRLMAVNTKRIAAINPFSFTSLPKNLSNPDESPWKLLGSDLPQTEDGAPIIPGIVDQNTATYALQMGMGDRIEYSTDDGERFYVEITGMLATSILQGNVIISEKNFIRFFPDSGGYRYFLLDGTDKPETEKVSEHMTRMFGDRGLEMRPAPVRLNEFNAVQNTYLSIFSTLGGLGVLIGTLGLGIIVGRNVLERRGQLGVMQAIGFTRQALSRMVLAEHWFLHLAGVILGLVAAFIAVLPKIQSGPSQLPLPLLAGVNGAILVGGLAFCWFAARGILSGNLMDGLRKE